MKFSCLKEYLGKAISAAERFAGRNVNLPILSNILLETQDNLLKVTATNLEYAVQLDVPGKVSHPGKASVPAKILNSFLQSIQDEKIELEEKQRNLFIKTETVNTRINGLNPEDFPLVPKIKKTAHCAIDSILLKQALEKVISAASLSEFKPELTGIYCNILPRAFKFAATDTFRLAEKTLPREEEGDSFSFILPQRVAQELIRLLGEEGETRISLGEGQVLFEGEGVKVISRLVDGSFPEYGPILPKQFETSGHVEREELIRAVKSSSIFSSRIQEVLLKAEGKEIEVSSANAEIGEHKISLTAALTGKPASLGFNYRYLLDGLASLDEEEIFMGINNENSPSLLRNREDGSFLYVLMPIRLN